MKKALSFMLAFAMVIGTFTIVPASEAEAASQISGSFYWLGSDITPTGSANGGQGVPTYVDTMYSDTKAITILDETATKGGSAWSGGTTYEHGLGVHPKNSAAGFTDFDLSAYDVNRFYAVCGMTNTTLKTTGVKFTLNASATGTSGTWVQLEISPEIKRGQSYVFDVDITGYKFLKLNINQVGTYESMASAWGNACVYKSNAITLGSGYLTSGNNAAGTTQTSVNTNHNLYGHYATYNEATMTYANNSVSQYTLSGHPIKKIEASSPAKPAFTEYEIPDGYNAFHSTVGFFKNATNKTLNDGQLKFTVIGYDALTDGEELYRYESPAITRGQDYTFNVDLTGAKLLRLEVEHAGGNYANMDYIWANPYVDKCACATHHSETVTETIIEATTATTGLDRYSACPDCGAQSIRVTPLAEPENMLLYLGSDIAIGESKNFGAGSATTVDKTLTLYGATSSLNGGKTGYGSAQAVTHSLAGHPQSATKPAYTEISLAGLSVNQFHATVGYASNGYNASGIRTNALKFTVFGYDEEGTQIYEYESPALERGAEHQNGPEYTFNVDITGAESLRLEVAHAGGTYAAENYIWADPYVSNCACDNHYSEILAETISERTCTTDGIYKYTACPDCGAQRIVTVPAGHKSMEVLGTDLAATTTATGSLKYYHCDVCNKYFFDTDALFECTGADDPRLVLEKRTEALGYTAGYPTEAAVKENAVYLSDKIVSSLMAPAGGSADGRTVKTDLNWSGNTITIGDVSYTKGLGIIPPMPFYADSYVLCDISETGANRFYSVVGMDGSAATTDTSAANYGNGIAYYVFGSKNVTTSTDRADYDLLACSGDLFYRNGGVLEADITDYKTLLLVNDVPTLVNYGCNGVWANTCVYSVATESLTGMQVNVGKSYSVNIFANGVEEGAKLHYEYGNKVGDITEFTETASGTGLYVFTLTDITPNDICQDITFTLKDAEETVIDTTTVSIAGYLTSLKELYPTNTELLNLIADMIVFADSLQTYTKVSAGAPLTDCAWAVDYKTEGVCPVGVRNVKTPMVDKENFISAAGLRINSHISVYFRINWDGTSDISVSLTSKVGEADVVILSGTMAQLLADGKAIQVDDGRYAIFTDDLSALEADEVHTLLLTKGTDTIGELEYNADAYMQVKWNDSDTALADVCHKLAAYTAAAKAYVTAYPLAVPSF